MWQVLKHKEMFFVVLSIFLSHIQEGYIDPTLVPYYKSEFKVSDERIAVMLTFFGAGILFGAVLVVIS